MKKITIGILAHVDAGKTTLAEAILYSTGKLRELGRVDKKTSFLDNFDQERKRGITIFSKQARFEYENIDVTLLDTPGHADFSSEMERCLQVLDYAILVISGTDGVQAHTRTLFSLLATYNIPTFIFITKMDVSKLLPSDILQNLKENLSENCFDFSSNIDYESIALLDETILEKYLQTSSIQNDDISSLIKNRHLFPCIFGSGLKLEGIDSLLSIINLYSIETEQQLEFGAKVFSISRDNNGKRMTHVKITGGHISVRDQIGDDKISQIRLYSGFKYETVDSVSSGDICTFLGLTNTYPGQGLGCEIDSNHAVLEPVLSYRLILPKAVDPLTALPLMRELEDEDPMLHVVWNSRLSEIQIQLMGSIQIEILKATIKDRFGFDVDFDKGNIIYKETITNTVEGIGHYEPLKHYAEVHLLLEPAERDSGISISTNISQDELDLNWQRLILTHIKEKEHLGVLCGYPITDIKISLIAGQAHLKHTEGGDFRQATYRAIRQGLMKADSIVLEPLYSFILEVPSENIGRALTDIHNMGGEHDAPYSVGLNMIISGTAPVSKMMDNNCEVLSYTSGKGSLTCKLSGYVECDDPSITCTDYLATSDLDNTPDSVFCSHGAGINIPWNEVDNHCHIAPIKSKENALPVTPYRYSPTSFDDAELEKIMEREFGPIKRKKYSEAKVIEANPSSSSINPTKIIVDGYNLLHSWDEIMTKSKDNLDLGRELITNELINYSSYTGKNIILVFDAYAVVSGVGSKHSTENLHIVFTKEGESADAYIERLIDEIGKNENVKVVSSDSMIQLTAVRTGVIRVSAREFILEVENTRNKIKSHIE